LNPNPTGFCRDALKRELLPDAEGFPVDEEYVSSLVIFDAEVIAPRE
jgi:hypothetical protein